MSLFLTPRPVKPAYKQLPPFIAKDFEAFTHTSERPGWNGYWGDPAEASQALGQALFDDVVARTTGQYDREAAEIDAWLKRRHAAY